MNSDILKGNWKELRGEVKRKWGKLTDDDLTEISGTEESLIGALQKNYGYARDEAEKEYEKFMTNVKPGTTSEEEVTRRRS